MADQIAMDERKQVTVLFADLSGFTSLSEELDPEEISMLLNTSFEAIANVVNRYDGHINQYVGDEVVVLFGAPIAHEDDPERAVRAALEIMDAVEQLELDIPDEVKWHIGINSGLVVAGEMGASHKREYSVVGDAVNTASRILDAAEEGQILVGESVYQRTRGVFEYVEFGAVRMKGKREKVAVYQPIRALPRQRRLDRAMQRGPSKFVGRGTEIRSLRDAFDRSATKGPQILAVQAPAGSGKSRLLYEFRHRLPADVTFLEGEAVAFGEVSAFQPFLHLLRRHWGLADRSGEEIEEDLTNGLEQLGLLDRKVVFEDLFSFDQVDSDYAELSPQRRRTLTMAVFTSFFEEVAGRGRTVVAIDDLQWADQSTVELIGTLIERMGSNLLLVLLARPEFKWPWDANPDFSLLTLRPLDVTDSSMLIRHLLDGEPSQELVDYIVERTEGNPLFTEELVRALEEGEDLELNGDYRLSASRDGPDLPETVQGIISARIDRLAAQPKQVLETAGVIGRAFDAEVLQHVLDVEADWLDEQLGVLIEAQFIDPPSDEGAPHQFVHALTREVAYTLPLNRVRRKVHARVAAVLEEMKPDMVQTHPEILAQHYTEARIVEMAVPLWQRAAEKAIERSANAEAIAHVEVALDLIRGVKDAPDPELELQLLTTLAVALLTTRGFTSTEVEKAYAQARDVGSHVDDPAMLGPALRGLWIFHNMRGDYDLADQLARELLELAERTDDTGLVLEARRASGITAMAKGELDEAERHLTTGLRLSETGDHSDHIHLYGQDPLVANLVQMGWLQAMRGDLLSAVDHVERSVARARELHHGFSIAGSLFMSAMVESLCYHWEGVNAYAVECVDVAGEHQFGFLLAQAHILAAWSRARIEETPNSIAEGVEALQMSLAAYEKSGASWILPYYEACLADQLHRLGKPEQAGEIVAQGLARAETTGERSWIAELLRVRATIRRSADDGGDVGHELREAIEIARGQGAVTFELAALVELARTGDDEGTSPEARDRLGTVLESFTAEADHPLLVEAEAVLSGG
jgi:class 3 adenylate cyclase/predicted ATPase